ncbi:hypothetical protein HID58_062928, partial [Brassica napus]
MAQRHCHLNLHRRETRDLLFHFVQTLNFVKPFALLLLLLRFCFTNLLINQYTFHFFFPLISFMASFRIPPRFVTYKDILSSDEFHQQISCFRRSYLENRWCQTSAAMAIIEHQRSEDYDPSI